LDSDASAQPVGKRRRSQAPGPRSEGGGETRAGSSLPLWPCGGGPLEGADAVVASASASDAAVAAVVANVSACFRALRHELIDSAQWIVRVSNLLPFEWQRTRVLRQAPPEGQQERLDRVCRRLPRPETLKGSLRAALGRDSSPLLVESATLLLRCAPKLEEVANETEFRRVMNNAPCAPLTFREHASKVLLKIAYYVPGAADIVRASGDLQLVYTLCAPLRPSFCLVLLDREGAKPRHRARAGDSLLRFYRRSRCLRHPDPGRRDMCRTIQDTVLDKCSRREWQAQKGMSSKCYEWLAMLPEGRTNIHRLLHEVREAA